MNHHHSSKQIKLHARSRFCSRSSNAVQEVPWLNVSGLWLEKLGFHIGETVRITTRERLLIIEPLEGATREQQEYKRELQTVKQTLKQLSQ